MKNLKKNDIIAAVLCLLGIVPGAAVYDKLPDRMITGWDMNNGPNQTQPKAFVVFGMPLIFAAVILICCIIIRMQKRNTEKMITLMCVLTPALFYCVQGIMLLYALGKLNDIRSITCIVISVLMIVLGNYLPKIRKNWFVGIRTPHSLMSDEVWYKTHRLAGFTVTFGGAVSLATALLGHYMASAAVITAAVLLPSVYAEVIYFVGKKKQ